MFNIYSILDSLMHRNDKIYLYCQQIWCGLWRSSVCVLLVCIVYIVYWLCTVHRLFHYTILSDRKIKSPKNNSVDFIVASRINQGFVWAIHNAVFCRLRVSVHKIGCIRKYTELQCYTSLVIICRVCHAILHQSRCFVLKC